MYFQQTQWIGVAFFLLAWVYLFFAVRHFGCCFNVDKETVVFLFNLSYINFTNSIKKSTKNATQNINNIAPT